MGKPKNKIVQVKYSTDGHKKLMLNAQMNGFPTVSEYVRYVTLTHNEEHHRLMREVHQALVPRHQKNLSSKPTN